MKKQLIFLFFFAMILFSSCTPMLTNFEIVDEQQKIAVTDIMSDSNLVHLKIDAIDLHNSGGNVLTIFIKIYNNSKDTIYFQNPPFQLRSENFNVSLLKDAKDVQPTFLAPNDSTKQFFDFSNDFSGTYKKFLVYLSKARIYVRPMYIRQHNKEFDFSEYELVYRKNDTLASESKND